MNSVSLIGRLTKDPEVRYTTGNNRMAVGRYTLAVDRRFKKEGEASADFINILTFSKSAEFAEKYFHKGMKVAVNGRIQTGSYTNKDGQKVYTTEVVVDNQEFCESKSANEANTVNHPSGGMASPSNSDFMDIPDDFPEELPFD